MHQTLMTEIAIGNDCLRTVLGDDGFPTRGNFIQCRVPGNPRKLFAAFRPGPAQRIEQAIGVVVSLLVVLQFYAQPAARHGVIWIAFDTHEFAVLDFEDHRAGIGTIMRAAAVMGRFHDRGHRNSPSLFHALIERETNRSRGSKVVNPTRTHCTIHAEN